MIESQNASSHIDADQLLGRISELSNKVQKIESFCGRSLHTIIMRNEIEALQDQLSSGQKQADPGRDHEKVDASTC